MLLARVDGSAAVRESVPGALTDDTPRLSALLDEMVAGHGGVRCAARADGDLVATFPTASEAVACALDLQRAPLAPVRLRVCVHAGVIGSPPGNGDPGPKVGRAARLLELTHDGQTVLTGVTGDVVRDRLPEGAWLLDLGSHRLPDLGRAERVWQLCHREARVEYPALRSLDAFPHNLPVQLTRFVGREAEISQVRRLVADNRLVTLTGAGGAGKSRLALQVAAGLVTEFPAGVWLADLAPLTDAALVPVTVARALGLPDEKGRSTMATVAGFIAAGRVLVALDNCEHLLEASAVLVEELLRVCPALSVVATSREPLGVAGEAIWRVPSLPLAGEAIELFADRAQRARPGFAITPENSAAIAEICRRLDGMPLAIELAAARLRAFSPAEIAAGLHDRFRLLTGGSRTAVRRQQTLRASVDWSYALLTGPERTLFRRLAAFAGGFDLDAAQAVGAGDGLDRDQVLDQLAMLVDKSLVTAEEAQEATRYRLLETVRQYALEKLSESGQADAVRARHRDHYTAMAARLHRADVGDASRQIGRLEADIDNLRAAFQWSLELSDSGAALGLASALQPMWLGRCRMLEGLAWFDVILAGDPAMAEHIAPAVRARALADASVLESWTDGTRSTTLAGEAVALARQVADPALLGRALAAAGSAAGYLYEDGLPFFEEAIVLARQAADDWTLALILGWQSYTAATSGDPVAARAASLEGLALAQRTGNDLITRQCRAWLGWAMVAQGDLHQARSLLSGLVAEAEADKDLFWQLYGLPMLGVALALLGEREQARAAGEASIAIAADLGVTGYASIGHLCLAEAAKAAGDPGALREASQLGWRSVNFRPAYGVPHQVNMAEAALAEADVAAARQHSDEAVAAAARLGLKFWLMLAHLASARVAAAAGDVGRAHDDAHQALIVGRGIRALLPITDTLEFLGGLPHRTEEHKAARLLGAADTIRRATSYQRFRLYQDGYDAAVLALRSSMGDAAFDHAFAEGAALTLDEVVNYALRGRGQRGRPAAGWQSLTPAERDVARLVSDGLANRDIAVRLFVSPRTVQAHLTHIYGKLGITSRMQLAQQAARHTSGS